jgi:hypothetical protein
MCKIAPAAAGLKKFPASDGIAFEYNSFSISDGAADRSHQACGACSYYANFRSFQSKSPQAIAVPMMAKHRQKGIWPI